MLPMPDDAGVSLRQAVTTRTLWLCRQYSGSWWLVAKKGPCQEGTCQVLAMHETTIKAGEDFQQYASHSVVVTINDVSDAKRLLPRAL